MRFKFKFTQMQKLLSSGELARRQPELALYLSWAMNLLLGAVLASAPLLDGCAPFGVAITAQAGGQLAGLFCALGAAAGYLGSFGFDTGIRYVAAVTLSFTASYVFQARRAYRESWFMPVLAGCFTMVTGILGLLAVPGGGFTPILLQSFAAAAGCYFFREALRTGERDTEPAELRHMISLTILLGCLLMSLSGARLGGIVSLGRLCCLLLVQVAAYKGGALVGCAVGCTLGLAMDMVSALTPFYAMAYGTGGLVSGVFSRSGRSMYLISAVLTGAVLAICGAGNGLRSEFVIELLVSSGLFLLLPGQFLNYAGTFVRPLRMADGEAGLRRYTARRIRRMGEAFRDLYATVDEAVSVEDNPEDITSVFDRASDLICSKCKNKSECWNKEYMDTLSVFNDVVGVIRERGLLQTGDLAEHFQEKCLNPDGLVSAINGELRGRMYRRQFQARLLENRSAAYSQYLDVAEVLAEVSEELQNAYGPDYLVRRRLARYLTGAGLEADISVFRDRIGRLHIVMESPQLKRLLREPGYLDKLSSVVGTRLCRPIGTEGDGEGRITLLEAEPYAASVGIASLKKRGEAVSGDRGTYFKTDHGVLCVILSDGMGSGESAAKEAVAAVRILERFLRAGVDPAVAMKMLNSMMLLKNNDNWGFVTVDLMCVDLFTGEAAFYKYGAAPSYVRSGNSVKRIQSDTLAAGLSSGTDAMPDIVRMRLKPGNLALIASDGVIAGSNDAWIRNLLGEFNNNSSSSNDSGADTKELARQTLQTALQQYGSGDDMTVLAIRVDNRA